MRDRDGAALLDLLFEDRDDAAVGAEDVAEADGHELGADVAEEFCICLEVEFFLAAAGLRVMREELRNLGGLAFLDLGVETLDDHLAQALRGAHDVGRVDGLIGGDQHKALAAVHHGRVGGLVGADGVVFDGLAGAVLHERHMLVGRCVVDDVGLVLFEDLEHLPRVAHGTDQRDEIELGVLFLEFQLYIIGIVFVDVEDDEALRMMVRDLPAELAANRSAATRDEHGLAVKERKDLPHIDPDGIATEKIFDGHIFEVRYRHVAVYELIHARQILQLTPGLLANAQNIPACRHLCRGNRKEYLLHMIILDRLHDVIAAADDRHAVDVAPLLILVIIDDAHNAVADFLRRVDVAKNHLSGCSRADDHDVGSRSFRLADAGFRADQENKTVRKANPQHETELDDGSDDIVREGHAVALDEGLLHVAHHGGDSHGMHNRSDHRCDDGPKKLRVACETPDTLIEP